MLNRRNGPEQVMQLVEERAPDGYNVVTDVLSQKELEDIAPTTSASPAFRSGASMPSRRSCSYKDAASSTGAFYPAAWRPVT